jgi:RHS repeat-associated protein
VASTSFIRDPDGNLISMRNSAGASYYFTTDALGSVIALTDSAQAKVATYTYDSWGKTTATGSQAATHPWQYAGGYKDTTTGYTKFGARYYNPTTGRFTQPDPSGQEDNGYIYAGSNRSTKPTAQAWISGRILLVQPHPSLSAERLA